MKNKFFEPTEDFQAEVGTSYSIGFELMKKYFVELLLLAVISIATQLPGQILTKAYEYMDGGFLVFIFVLFGAVYSLAIMPITYGIDYVYLKLVRGEKFEVADVFKGFKDNYLEVILSGLLVFAIVAGGFILLIIPGIIFACKLVFVPYIVMDKQMDAISAVKKSWDMTTGHTLTIFLMFLLAIPIFILGLICLIVGVVPAAMWISSAFASFYHSVDKSLEPEMVIDEVIVSEV